MNNLRDWLTHLDKTDRLATIKPGCHLQFEVMAILERLEGQKACFFQQPGGHAIPIAGGTLAQRSWIAEAMGVKPDEILTKLSAAVANPLPWTVIDDNNAPVHENRIDQGFDIKKTLPVITYHELDGGPYITSGLVHGINLNNKRQNVSINRIQIHAPDKMGILMLPRDLYAYYQIAEERNEPLPVTITLGHDPLTKLASQAIAPRDLCELEIAGAMHGKPLEVVKSYTNDIYIPAHAEIAIEGRILPHLRSLEGPFGEFPKYYSGQNLLPFIEITCITHRNNPIYEINNPSGAENIVLGGVPREASLLERIKVNFPNVIDLRLTPGGLGRYHIVIKMKKNQIGEAKNVIANAFACHYDIKFAIVVDEDINIDSSDEVEWAVATRFQADKDLVVIHHALGSKLDPSTEKRGMSSKVGLDATAYLDRAEKFYVTKVPGENELNLSDYLQNTSSAFQKYVS